MHILFLSHYFPPEVNAPASRTYEHAKRWVLEPGIKVTVVTNHPNHPKGLLFPGYRNRWISKEEVDGISVVRVKTLLAANAGIFRRTANYLFFMLAATVASTRIKSPDVVMATSPQFFCALAGYFVAVLKRRPFVFELRDIWPDSIVTVGAMKTKGIIRLLEKLELFLYRKAALIIVVTESFRENLITRGVSPSKIAVVMNGVDLEFYQPRPVSAEVVMKVGAGGKFVAAYIGTIGMAHAVEKIVEAAELLRDHKDILVLVIGEGARRKNVEDLVSSKRLRNIKVLPGVGKSEVRDYYSLTDLNLVTLRNKPLFRSVIPSKIFEIMAMARPILSSVQGESRRILEAAEAAEFVDAEDPLQMADAILRLRSDARKLAAMGKNGRRFVERNFSRTRSAAECLTYLKDCGLSRK